MAKKKAQAGSGTDPYHVFHAQANLLRGRLEHPVKRTIRPHSEVKLEGLRGGHRKREAQNVNIDNLVHLRKGHTRVSGGGTLKHKGWISLATAVLEGLNVFEVVAADRVVSQVSTEHAWENGHVPSVTFLGSHFDNLRINGYPLKITLDLEICGKKPPDGQSYLSEASFLQAAKAQLQKITDASRLPKDLETEYAKRLADVNALLGGNHSPNLKATCSLVQSIDNINEIPVPGIRALGHVLVIPEFGWVALGEIEVSERMYPADSDKPCVQFGLTMLQMNLGCIGGGTLSGGGSGTNGAHHP